MNNLQNVGVTPRDTVNVLETRTDAKDTCEEATQEMLRIIFQDIRGGGEMFFPGKSHFICHVGCHPQLI